MLEKKTQQKSKVATLYMQAKVTAFWYFSALSMHDLQSVHSLRQKGL